LIELEKEGSIYTLTMDAGENRWNTTFVREFSAALDQVEQDDGPGALVTRIDGTRLLSGSSARLSIRLSKMMALVHS